MRPADPPPDGETIVQNDHYQISRIRTDAFVIVRIAGRSAESLLDDLRTRVFTSTRSHYALDLSGLTGVNAALAREIADTAEILKSGERRLVLLRPPEALKSLLTMQGRKASLEMALSEEQLGAPAEAGSESGFHAPFRELERIGREFQSNRAWQYIDREGCWICPFCARVVGEVRVASALNVGSAALEKAYRHLWSKCPDFKPTAPRLRPLTDLQEALKQANSEKLIVPRQKFDKMESQIAALKGKAQELEESMKRASERQRRLLPAKPPEVPGAEIELLYRPAEDVSGDFYDFVPLDEGRVAMLVGDVSGHGIEAGVVMGMAKKVIALRLQDFQDPVEALKRTNDDVDRDLGRVSFVTAFVAIFDPAARTLCCARAGHNPPLLFNPDREPRCRSLRPGGLGLGIMDQEVFEPSLEPLEIEVKAGDVFLLYTDGLVEARNPEGDQFGVERTVEVLASTYGYPPAMVLSTLSATLDRFTAGRISDDDITAVCVRFT